MYYDCGKNDSAADYRINARNLTDAEKNPDGIKYCFENSYDKGFRSGDVFHSDIEDKITHANLENPHVQQNQELSSVETHVRENKGQADCCYEEISENNRHDCVFMPEIFLPFKEQREESETDSRTGCNKVAVETSDFKFFHEEKRHAGDADNDSEQIPLPESCFQEKRFKEQKIEGRRKLKKDCVSRCCHLICDYKKYEYAAV